MHLAVASIRKTIPMPTKIKQLQYGLLLAIIFFSTSFFSPAPKAPKPATKKIQVAILLDVSNSMDGLIEQAKAQL